jgi:hypothetical protein
MRKPKLKVWAGCRDDWIRTSDPFVPNEVRFRAALHPENIKLSKLHFVNKKSEMPHNVEVMEFQLFQIIKTVSNHKFLTAAFFNMFRFCKILHIVTGKICRRGAGVLF